MAKFFKTIKRRGRIWLSRNDDNNCSGNYNWLSSSINSYYGSIRSFAYKKRRKHENNKKFRLLKDIKGAVISVEMLIYIPLISFILFSGVDYYITSVQHNNLENRKNYYLDIMRIEGTYNTSLEQLIKTELDNMGFEDIEIIATTYNDYDLSTVYVHRNIDNPYESRMKLQITASPKFKPFVFGRLLGVEEEDKFSFLVKGEALSERPIFEDIEENP